MFINNNFCLKSFNTFGIEAIATKCAQITSTTDMTELFESKELENQELLVIGEASNILFLSNFKGLILMNLMTGEEVISENENEVILKVNAGEYWTNLVDFTVKKGWWGIENLSLIPGKVGASPVQNIGAYGVELKDVFVSLQAFDMKNGKIVNFSKEECKFGYRNSIFKNEYKGRFMVLNVTIRLSKVTKPNLSYKTLADIFIDKQIEEISLNDVKNAVDKIRESKLPDPQIIKNAGSFFKNPIVENIVLDKLRNLYPNIPSYKISDSHSKLAAGWLIEKCGWKGKRIGDAAVHNKQALVLVNHGTATGKEIFMLSEKIKLSVSKKFGVELEREVLAI